MLKNKQLLLIASFLLFFASLSAQTNSPYSRYGYGVLKDQSTGLSRAMGGAKYGIRSKLNANAGNPASYTAVDSLTFLFDMSVYVNNAKLTDPGNSRSDWNGGLDYITLLFPVSKQMAISAGLLPVSSVGYDFANQGEVGEITYLKTYNGSGGFSQAYLGLGYDTPLKGLSVGFNVSYIFGTLKHRSSLAGLISEENYPTTSAVATNLRLTSYKFDFGAQYALKFKDYRLVLGAAYTPAIHSKASFKEITTEIDNSGNTIAADEVRKSKADAGTPEIFGLGGALHIKNKWTLAADISYEKWKSVRYTEHMQDGLNSSNRFNNRFKYNAGAEFIANPYSRNFFERTRFRGGLNYSESYANVKSVGSVVSGYDEYGATIGFGLPLYDSQSFGRRTSYINLSFDYKLLKPKVSGLVKERYFGLTLSVSFNEYWFHKRKAH